MQVENLIENVDNQIINIRTKSLDVSFNELYDMYTDGELIIAPDYQRLFRWEAEKQSRFMESLILEMPVPPHFCDRNQRWGIRTDRRAPEGIQLSSFPWGSIGGGNHGAFGIKWLRHRACIKWHDF